MFARIYVVLVFVVLSAGCSTALRRTAQITEVAAYAGIACDMYGTSHALHTGQYGETNPILGESPPDEELAFYGSGVSVGIFGLNRLANAAFENKNLASFVRIVLNGIVVYAQVDSLQWNAKMGAPLCGL